MIEIKGNIWDLQQIDKTQIIQSKDKDWILVPIPKPQRKSMKLDIIRGWTTTVDRKCTYFSEETSYHLRNIPDFVSLNIHYNLIAFVTKLNWKDKSNLQVIENSCKELVTKDKECQRVYIPYRGFNEDGIEWHEVKQIFDVYLDKDKYIMVYSV